MSEQFHGAPTCSSFFNTQSFVTEKRRFGPFLCHDSIWWILPFFRAIHDWNSKIETLFTNGPKRARNSMPSFMKGLRSRPCHCRPSQVSSGRPGIGQKQVWLFFSTWTEANSRKTKMIIGVLPLVFPCPNTQSLGTGLTGYFHVLSGNWGKFAGTSQVYGFGCFGVSGPSKYHLFGCPPP